MDAFVTWFDPQPDAAALPARLPSPFDPGGPHPLAQRAADVLLRELGRGQLMTGADLERGKMFGVLVVEGAGRVGYLRGFSGMLGGSWQVDGFVGPVFDAAKRDATWPAGEAELLGYDQRVHALARAAQATRTALAALDDEQRAEGGRHAADDEARRQVRDAARLALGAAPEAERQAALAELAQASRADTTAFRQRRHDRRERRAPLASTLRALEEERAQLKRHQAARSCELLEHLFAGYAISNARGERRPLRALFAPATPPGGAADCAGPKLFAHAIAAGLRPLALAEFWWGPPSITSGRRSGVFYPSCRGKCGPVLAHMLDGLAVDPPPVFGADAIAAHEPAVVFEDDWLVVVEKPVGLLSVPGRSNALADCVLTRLRARYPHATGPLLVHRLDLDTSGLLLAAKDAATHVALQRLFWRRAIEKRYVAWLEGAVAGDAGTIDLALRVDLDDRPRQIHDPDGGKPAITDWQVLARTGARTHVAFIPRTGRSHQLRVHAAHPLGLGAAIVGDRIYGAPDRRLMLHAESLRFVHPHTGAPVHLVRPAPF